MPEWVEQQLVSITETARIYFRSKQYKSPLRVGPGNTFLQDLLVINRRVYEAQWFKIKTTLVKYSTT